MTEKSRAEGKSREDRLAEQLRANLRRRKAAARKSVEKRLEGNRQEKGM